MYLYNDVREVDSTVHWSRLQRIELLIKIYYEYNILSGIVDRRAWNNIINCQWGKKLQK